MASAVTLDLAITDLAERLNAVKNSIEAGDSPEFGYLGQELAEVSKRAETLASAAFATDAAQSDV